jgi:hypothetical protein
MEQTTLYLWWENRSFKIKMLWTLFSTVSLLIAKIQHSILTFRVSSLGITKNSLKSKNKEKELIVFIHQLPRTLSVKSTPESGTKQSNKVAHYTTKNLFKITSYTNITKTFISTTMKILYQENEVLWCHRILFIKDKRQLKTSKSRWHKTMPISTQVE